MRLSYILIFLFVFHISFASQNKSKIPPTAEGLTIMNAHQVAEGIYRGQMPYEKVSELKAVGVDYIISIRQKDPAEEEEVAKYSRMKLINIPMNYKGIDMEHIDQKIIAILKEFYLAEKDPKKHSVYLHCTLGEDRTGMIVGIYRMLKGATKKEARDEMLQFGYKTGKLSFITRELTTVFNSWAESISTSEITWKKLIKEYFESGWEYPLRKK